MDLHYPGWVCVPWPGESARRKRPARAPGESGSPGKSGVHGFNNDPAGDGVYGENVPSGNFGYLGSKEQGVHGFGAVEGAHAVTGEHSRPTATAIYGVNSATGVHGAIGARRRVLGFAPTDLAHYGLYASGRVAFANRSGRLTKKVTAATKVAYFRLGRRFAPSCRGPCRRGPLARGYRLCHRRTSLWSQGCGGPRG